jgi:hypothetical protein
VDDFHKRASQIASHLSAKYGSRAPARNEDDVTKRDNEFSVVRANQPSGSDSAGIHQDGSDFSYFVEVALGAEGKKLYMLLDTGASTSWVMGDDCTSSACSMHNSFGEGDSSTYTDTGSTFEVFYGSGTVSGKSIEDSISLAGLKVNMEFGVASKTSDTFTQFPFDGIMGVSMGDKGFMAAVSEAGLLDANLFGVALSRADDGLSDGEVSFGAPNQNKYKGDISYTSTTVDGSWAIPLEDVTVDGNSVGISRTAYIDTGTTYAFGPPADVKKIFSTIEGASSSNGQTYTIPCDSDVPVAMTFSGSSWTISSKDLISEPNSDGNCVANLYGMEVVEGAFLLGDTFLKNVYTVFDIDQSRIGFATRATSSTSDGGESNEDSDNDNNSGKDNYSISTGTSTSSATSTGFTTSTSSGSGSGSGSPTPTPTSSGPGDSTVTDSPSTTDPGLIGGLLPGETSAPEQSEEDSEEEQDGDKPKNASIRQFNLQTGLASAICFASIALVLS